MSTKKTSSDINSHLWGYLVPLGTNPRVLRIDFWRITPTCVLGRDPAAVQVILPGGHISGKHASITWNQELGKRSMILLSDTSSNGTWVNDEKVVYGEVYELVHGDQIIFGADAPVPDEDGLYDYRYTFHHVAVGTYQPKIDELYLKGDLLGQGTYGTVYKATERKTGQVVAVKSVEYHLKRPTGCTPVLGEIRALQRVRHHPHVIKILGSFPLLKKPLVFVVLEYMPGNLFDYMEQESHTRALWPEGPDVRGLPEEICREIMYQLCHAMGHMHKLGVTHRDLKPENILIGPVNGAPFIKVADFGLAKIEKNINQPTLMTSIVGSAVYVAPEVTDPRVPGYDHYSDSFSAGVIMFTMIILVEPWCEPRVPPGRPPLPKMRWKYLTTELMAPEGLDLLDHLVQPDPHKRVSLTGALTHRWMKAHTPMHITGAYGPSLD
ncbi:kinase-like domain-containing protein [Mycena belliarum]|uniref:non-specific serine/threonine protein kinase n=1 Tax=Mycena belliarum TaxID=1033014 RepID=A0AAD6TTJ5_9AGAR|nr:kinase-like domain-containing protein [Mycena belliae]